MPRSGTEARERLGRAALELYLDRGYDRTSTAEIAARAGVTERTFFRHFADKREVFFDAETETRAALARALAEVPSTEAPLAAVLRAFRARVPELERNRSLAEARLAVIAATPALRERELAKEAALSVVVADALIDRGVPAVRATLLGQVATTALSHARHTWLTERSGDIDALIVQAFADLREFADIRKPRRRRAS